MQTLFEELESRRKAEAERPGPRWGGLAPACRRDRVRLLLIAGAIALTSLMGAVRVITQPERRLAELRRSVALQAPLAAPAGLPEIQAIEERSATPAPGAVASDSRSSSRPVTSSLSGGEHGGAGPQSEVVERSEAGLEGPRHLASDQVAPR
jgi:hypothetical protein